jgi:hypothetical protein
LDKLFKQQINRQIGVKLLLSCQKIVVSVYKHTAAFSKMNYLPTLYHVSSTNQRRITTSLKNNNADVIEGKYRLVTSDLNNNIHENCPTFTLPKLASKYAGDSQPVLTKPKLLRKKDSEIQRYKKSCLKTSMDCVTAISKQQFAVESQKELRQKLHELKIQYKTDLKAEKLRNKEKLLHETEELRWQRYEACMMLETKNVLIRRLRMRVKQLEQIDKQKVKEINQMKQELKNMALKKYSEN